MRAPQRLAGNVQVSECCKNSPKWDSRSKWIQRLFRGETKPSKHPFQTSGKLRRTFASETERELQCKSCLSTEGLKEFRTAYGNVKSSQEQTRRDLPTFTCVTCEEVRLSAQRAKEVFRGLCFTPKLSRNQFWPLSRLGAILATVRQGNSGWFSGLLRAELARLSTTMQNLLSQQVSLQSLI